MAFVAVTDVALIPITSARIEDEKTKGIVKMALLSGAALMMGLAWAFWTGLIPLQA